MAGSLIKFIQETKDESGRGNIYWGRAGRDGLPYRSQQVGFKTEEEYEETSVRVSDPHNGIFNVRDEAQNKQYLDILDKATNGWFTIIHIERWLSKEENTMYVYVEWLINYMEDGSKLIPD